MSLEKLGKLAEVISGQHVMAEHVNELGIGSPYLTGPADFPNGLIMASKYTDAGKKYCDPNDLLVTVKGSGVGKTTIANERYAISRQLMAIRAKPGANQHFINYSLENYFDILSRKAVGAIPGLSRNDILDAPLLSCEKIEQERIVEILSDADAAIATAESILVYQQRYLSGLIRKSISRLLIEEDYPLVLLDELVVQEEIELGRGNVISKTDIANEIGNYPIYSSSVKNSGKMGEYGKYMFDEELITWSIDGGGTFFFRPKHKFSITNVSGYLRAKPNKFNYRFLHSVLHHQHSFLDFDYQIKAHPSVIRELYKIPIVPLSEQESLAEAFENAEIAVEQGQNLITALKKQKRGLMQQLLTGKLRVLEKVQ